MDPSATPWRVLEDPANEKPSREGAAEPDAGRTVRVPRSAIVTGGIAVVLAVGAFVLAFGSGSGGSVAVEGGVPFESASPGASSNSDSRGAAGSGQIVVVEIVGAVERPGVFRLPADSRVGDLVAAAGGYGPRVDADRAGRELNLAAELKDGDQIRVPSRDDASLPSARPAGGGGQGAGGGSSAAGPIDLNRATEGELDTLPGHRSGHRGEDRRVPRGTAVHRGRGPADAQARRREDVRVAQGPRHGLLRWAAAAGWRSVRSSPRWRPVRSHRTTSGRRSRWPSPPSSWSARHVRVSVWPPCCPSWSERRPSRSGSRWCRQALPSSTIHPTATARGDWSWNRSARRATASRPRRSRRPATAPRSASPPRSHATRS